MNKKVTSMTFIIVLGFILFVYRNWFGVHEIIGGDWPYFWRETLSQTRLWPSLWAPWQRNGLGGASPLLGLQLFQSLLVVPFVNWLGLPWEMVYKIGWFGLFIILSIIGSKNLWEAVSFKSRKGFPWWTLTALIFTTNTYILMVTGGGQMGVALAYSIAPLVLSSFIKLTNVFTASLTSSKFPFDKLRAGKVQSSKLMIVAGLLLGFQVMIDPRIAYVTLGAVGLYYIVTLLHCYIVEKERLTQYFLWSAIILGSSLILAVLLNGFWLLPLVLLRNNPLEALGSAYTSAESLKFFSFADFSHALSLLHPNWPENLFGKTYFLQPEFLVLPIVAFSSLLTISKIKNQKSKIQIKNQKDKNQTTLQHDNRTILNFTLLVLLGAFLAKGANEPFGGVYVWLFERAPGFVMFRDPTKFYLLIAISYSVLIPFSIFQIQQALMLKIKNQTRLPAGQVSNIQSKYQKYITTTTVVLFVALWVVLIHPAIRCQLGGTFQPHTVPAEYVAFKDFLLSQPGFFRTLWVPRQSRFSYATLMHLASEAGPLFYASSSAELVRAFSDPSTPSLLNELGVKYVIIPYDSLGELFLEDRKYSAAKRGEFQNVLDSVSWLKKIQEGNITIYETPEHWDLFHISAQGTVSYTTVGANRYKVHLTVTAPTTLYFSQSYHAGWVAKEEHQRILPRKTEFNLSSFSLDKVGMYDLDVYFEPQKHIDFGLMISGTVFIIHLAGITLVRRRKFNYNDRNTSSV